MSRSSEFKILVTGATGLQGGSVVTALLNAGRNVRAFVRNSASIEAKMLQERGVEVVEGNFESITSLDAAMVGVSGVFSVQLASPLDDLEMELRTAQAIIDAAYRAGVDTFVQTSVARAGDHENFIGWGKTKPIHPNYWQAKAAVNESVRTKGFKHYTILKPALIMENLLKPRVEFMYPSLPLRGTFETLHLPETHNNWIAGKDIGEFAAAAFANPERFKGQEIDLASESVTMSELADLLTQGTGRAVKAISLSQEEASVRGIYEPNILNHQWDNLEGYKVDIEKVRKWDISLTSLTQFIAEHRNQIIIGSH